MRLPPPRLLLSWLSTADHNANLPTRTENRLSTVPDPWKSASLNDPTFYIYLQDPTRSLPTILPISNEVNALDVPAPFKVRGCIAGSYTYRLSFCLDQRRYPGASTR